MKVSIKLMALFLMMSPIAFADGLEVADVEMYEEEEFVVSVTEEQARVIEELVTTMGTTSVFSLAFKKAHLKKLAMKLRPVSSTQFLGYVFERQHLIRCMKNISESSIKWNSLTRSIVRGLKKEAVNSLFEDIPKFAQHTGGSQMALTLLARQEDWNGFIMHLIDQH